MDVTNIGETRQGRGGRSTNSLSDIELASKFGLGGNSTKTTHGTTPQKFSKNLSVPMYTYAFTGIASFSSKTSKTIPGLEIVVRRALSPSFRIVSLGQSFHQPNALGIRLLAPPRPKVP